MQNLPFLHVFLLICSSIIFVLLLIQRCLNRLREGRSKLVEKFRKVDSNEPEDAVKEVMEEEWNVLRQEKNSCLARDSVYNPFLTRCKVHLERVYYIYTRERWIISLDEHWHRNYTSSDILWCRNIGNKTEHPPG